MPDFDATAPTFDLYRGLPHGVPEAIRAAILASIKAPPRPRVLDLGAGTGRIGKAFVDAGDRYIGVDLSLGMLRQFAASGGGKVGRDGCLVQADGERLPFADAAFDVVLLIRVLSGARRWRRLLDEARRVLKAGGNIVVGHVAAPPSGIDAQLKSHLATILEGMGVELHQPGKGRDEALQFLRSLSRDSVSMVAASWTAHRTPREFMDRHRTGARFAALPAAIQEQALQKLKAWAEASFGSPDASFPEPYAFELHMFGLGARASRPLLPQTPTDTASGARPIRTN